MPAFPQSPGGYPSPSDPSSEIPLIPLQPLTSIPETNSRMVECPHRATAVNRIFGCDSCVPQFSLPEGIRIAKQTRLNRVNRPSRPLRVFAEVEHLVGLDR